MRPRPVIWKPRYATRRMREQAWAKADMQRAHATEPKGNRSLWSRLLAVKNRLMS